MRKPFGLIGAAALALAALPGAGGAVTVAPLSPLTAHVIDAEAEAVTAAARRCLDPRHVALVTNAVRRGIAIEAQDIELWCGVRLRTP